jgi:hypothetical protein
MGWPATTYGVVRPPQHIFIYIFGFFFLDKKSARGILGINMPNRLNYHNLKVGGGGGGGGRGGVKCHILNFGGKSENEWILQGVKCNSPPPPPPF